MKNKFRYCFSVSLCAFSVFFAVTSFSQSNKIDSLKKVLLSAKEDTNKVNALNTLVVNQYISSEPQKAFEYAQQALKLAEQIKWKKGIAKSEVSVGSYFYTQADYPNTLVHWLRALKYNTELNDKNGIAKSLGNIGLVYTNQADYPKAFGYYFKALKMAEELGLKQLQGIVLANIGNAYNEQADYPKAMDYYFKALKMAEEAGDKNGIALRLGNFGIVYKEQAAASSEAKAKEELFNKALDYYFKALKMAEELGDKNRISIWLSNIGNVYKEQAAASSEAKAKEELFNKALSYYFKALKMAEELGDKRGIAITLSNIGSLCTKTGKFSEAEKYLKHSISLGDSIGSLDLVRDYEESLSQLYDTTGRVKLAFEHYKKYIAARDSINSEENQKKQTRTEMNYEFEKKEAATKAEQDKKDAIATEEKRKQQIILLFVVGSLLLVLVFATFIFRSLRLTQRQKKLIEKAKDEISEQKLLVETQKKIVEEKNKDITDSIHYASRIQRSLLPNEKYIEKSLARLKS